MPICELAMSGVADIDAIGRSVFSGWLVQTLNYSGFDRADADNISGMLSGKVIG
jgi:hypothetical protein